MFLTSLVARLYKKEAIQIENVQRRATKLVKNISHLHVGYTERLKYFGLPSLQYRRLRADMLETYKILNDVDHVQHEKIFPIRTSNTRGHKTRFSRKTVD